MVPRVLPLVWTSGVALGNDLHMYAELADGGAVVLGSSRAKLRYEAGDIVSAVRQGQHTVSLRVRGGQDIALIFADGEGAEGDAVRALFAHLRIADLRQAITVPLRPVLGVLARAALFYTAALPFFFLFGVAEAILLAFFLLPIVAIAAALVLARSEMVIGDDGLSLRGPLVARFVGFGELEAVRSEGVRVRIERTGGRPLLLRPPKRTAQEAELLATSIERALQAYRRDAEGSVELLGRGKRPLASWRRELEQVARGAGGFRQLTLTPDRLARIVADAAAPLEQRVGAVLALRAVDPQATSLARIAAGASAHPRVRVALETVAADEVDEVRLERALRV